MEKSSFSFRKRISCFKYAFQGIGLLIGSEHNAWIHTAATVLVVLAGFFFKINLTEWMFVIWAVGGVFAGEAFNTAIEKLADMISPGYHPVIKQVKDVAAGGVLLIAIAAAITGCIIFIPKILLLLNL